MKCLNNKVGNTQKCQSFFPQKSISYLMIISNNNRDYLAVKP